MISRFYARSSFWLAYPIASRSALTLMTPEFRRFVGSKCTNGCLVLHVRRDEFTELIARWKAQFGRLKILRYTKIQRINSSAMVGASFYDVAYEHRYEWCILRNAQQGEPGPQPRIVDGFLWMDITNSDFRQAVVQHLRKEVLDSGCDGLAIDSHHWDLTDPGNIVGGAELNENWQAGAMSVLAELKAALGPDRLVMFNGLWGYKGHEQAVKQGQMLATADGIAVEFFGVDGKNKPGSGNPQTEWQWYVGNLNSQLVAVAVDKHAVINGQRPSGVYAHYADDYAAALYCYADFLLGPLDPKHGFHAGNFQCSKTDGERTGGYDYFDFQDLRLGPPRDDVVVKTTPGGKARVFEGGVVLIAPTAGGTQAFVLEATYYSMGGQTVSSGTRNLSAGRAEILLTAPPVPAPASLVVVAATSIPLPFTERMVQPIKSGWHRYAMLNLQLRSTDIGSAILVRVEVDDDQIDDDDKITHGIIVIRPTSGTFTKTARDYPYAEPPNGAAPNMYAPATYTADNTWKQLAISLDEAMGRTCHRVVSMRAIGSVQASLITLTGVAITHPAK
jgi:hypothetical protein